ncbi:MAG: carbamoyltransferase HypF, partial [Actinomycetota bacterium]
VSEVQHHHAHLAALLVEHGRPADEEVLGFVFDGTGHGTDRTTWGGEVLLGGIAGVERVGSLSPVPLPGGDAVARTPCRTALAHLAAAGIRWEPSLPPVVACTPGEQAALDQQLNRGRALPHSSSMGRLFDAVAYLGLVHRTTYEAQAAMALEAVASTAPAPARAMRFAVRGARIDPAPALRSLVDGVRDGEDLAALALAFHHAVVDAMVQVASGVRSERPVATVGLSGGCFQNALLTERATDRLGDAGFEVLTHRLVPPNDGGIALGQVAVAGARGVDGPSCGSDH